MHAARPSVGLAMFGVAQDGEEMVEQVVNTEPEMAEITLREWRKIGAACSVIVISQSVITRRTRFGRLCQSKWA